MAFIGQKHIDDVNIGYWLGIDLVLTWYEGYAGPHGTQGTHTHCMKGIQGT